MVEPRRHTPAEAELAALQSRLLDASPAEVNLFDADGRFLYASPASMRDPVVRGWVLGRTLHDR